MLSYMLLKKTTKNLSYIQKKTFTDLDFISSLPKTFISTLSIKKLYTPIFFFLRVQRRYNKRRLAKARVYSRTSFFSSCSLGSIFLALFWNASHKLTDWQSTLITIIDINSVLILFLIVLYIKTLSISTFFVGFSKLNKIKVLDNFKKWNLINLLFKWLK